MLLETAGLFIIFVFGLEWALNFREQCIEFSPVAGIRGKSAMFASQSVLRDWSVPIVI
jgi:hypothetical protein